MFTSRSKDSPRKSPMRLGHEGLSEGSKTHASDGPPGSRHASNGPRLPTRSLTRMYHVRSRVRAYVYTSIVSPVRANDSNVQKDGKRWVHGRTSGAMAVLGLLSDSCTRPSSARPERVTWKDREKEEVKREKQCRQHNHRVSVKIYPM